MEATDPDLAGFEAKREAEQGKLGKARAHL